MPYHIQIWIRSESANYGAEKYAREILNALNGDNQSSPIAKIYYITPKTKFFLVSALLYIFWVIFRNYHYNSAINIYTFPFMPFFLNKKHDILIFHHADPLRGSIKSRITEFFGLIFLKFASRKQLIITVSPFWEKFLREKFGFTNIKTIYNPLSLEVIHKIKEHNCSSVSTKVIKNYSKENCIIYLGNASPKKGWPLALKVAEKVYPNADYWVSGNNYTYVENVKVKHFQGTDREFMKFLLTVDISIFYSQFLEGWNRTLVEAALLSKSYVLNYAKSGGAVDAANLLTNVILFQDDEDLYNHLLKIKNGKEEKEPNPNHIRIQSVIDILTPNKFAYEWHLIIDKFLQI